MLRDLLDKLQVLESMKWREGSGIIVAKTGSEKLGPEPSPKAIALQTLRVQVGLAMKDAP